MGKRLWILWTPPVYDCQKIDGAYGGIGRRNRLWNKVNWINTINSIDVLFSRKWVSVQVGLSAKRVMAVAALTAKRMNLHTTRRMGRLKESKALALKSCQHVQFMPTSNILKYMNG